jgi:hypothetical protein
MKLLFGRRAPALNERLGAVGSFLRGGAIRTWRLGIGLFINRGLSLNCSELGESFKKMKEIASCRQYPW